MFHVCSKYMEGWEGGGGVGGWWRGGRVVEGWEGSGGMGGWWINMYLGGGKWNECSADMDGINISDVNTSCANTLCGTRGREVPPLCSYVLDELIDTVHVTA